MKSTSKPNARKPGKHPQLSLSKIKNKAVDWLWNDRIPASEVTLIDGHPGSGKSTVAAAIVSQVTGGNPLPLESKGPARNACWLTREEDYGATVVPRLVAAGAVLSRVLFPTDTGDERIPANWRLPTDAPRFATWIKDAKVGVCVFDPISSFLDSGVSLRDDTAIRSALEPLASIARSCRCAILLLRHFRKGTSGTAGEQGAGTYAFAAVARVQIGCYSSATDNKAKSVAWIKSNLGRLPATMSMTIKSVGPAVKAVWGGELSHTAEALAEGSGDTAERSAAADCDSMLRAELDEGRKGAADLKKIAESLGITPKQLRRSKERLRILSEFEVEGGVRRWYWVPPELWPDQPAL